MLLEKLYCLLWHRDPIYQGTILLWNRYLSYLVKELLELCASCTGLPCRQHLLKYYVLYNHPCQILESW
jgi:hypothetical protein